MSGTERIKKGLVTIVVPAYNAEQFLKENVESIINQTYKELEIIYVCDGCTDRTVEILQAYAKRDSRMTVRVERENHGAAITRNIGMDMASGEWIIFLDADDLYGATMIEEMLEAAVKAQADMACCYMEHFEDVPDEEASIDYGKRIRKLYCKTYPIVETAKEQSCIIQIVDKNPWGKLVHKSIYTKEEVFFQDIPNSNDVYYSIIAAINAKRIVFVDRVFCHYRADKGRHTLSSDKFKKRNYIFEACNQIFNYIKNKDDNEGLLTSFYNDVFMNLMYLESHIYDALFDALEDSYLDAWGMREKDISKGLIGLNKIVYRNVLNGNRENDRQKVFMEAKVDFVRETAKKGCAIWGTGLRGAELLEALSGTDIKIQHVYDSDRNKWETTVAGYVVEKPDPIESDNIIVTAPKYFDDIKGQINDSKKNIFNLEEQIWLMPYKESM